MFFFGNDALYEILKISVQPDRIGRQYGACTLHGGNLRIRHSEIVLLNAFPLQQ